MQSRPLSFPELVVLFAAQYGNVNTRSAYESDLDRFASWCATEQLTPLKAREAHISRYVAVCEGRGDSFATVSRRVSALSSFFAFAVDQGALARSPVDRVERRPAGSSTGVVLDRRQIAALLVAATQLGAKTDVLLHLLLFEGLRLAEVLAADAGHVDERATTMQVPRRPTPSQVELQTPTTRAITQYLGSRRTGPLLQSDSPTQRAARLTRFGADYLIKQASERASFDVTVSANTLRRSYVVVAVERGTSLDDVSTRLGHRDVRTTRRHIGETPRLTRRPPASSS